MQNTMSASLGDDDFYQNLFQFMNQSSVTQNPSFINPMPLSLSPHEAEKHARDENMMDDGEGDSKRRESANSGGMESGSEDAETKPKKKAGRKMMMTEPANKRKAQNRAAQRAFRERKEAHLKGLENRVTELEQLTETKDAENALLKNQVQTLQQELMRLRGPNFNFDFTVNNNTQTGGTKSVPVTAAAAPRNPFQPAAEANGQQSSPSPSSGSITDSSILRSGQSSLATSPENDANKNATPNIDVPFDLFSTSSGGTLTFNTNNSSNQPSLFSTDLFSNSPVSNASSSLFNQSQNQSASPILETFASTLASLQKGQSPPDITNANPFNSSMPSTLTPNSGSLYDLNDPLFSSWRDNSISGNAGDDSNFDIFDTMFSSMSPGAFNLADMTGLTEFITDSPINMQQDFPQQQQNTQDAAGEKITCPELWEQVKNHPNFDDIDIDQLCAEMRSKAKCSASGSVLSSRDVDETISRFVKSEDAMTN